MQALAGFVIAILLLASCGPTPERLSGTTGGAPGASAVIAPPEEGWADVGLTKSREPRRLLIRKIVWRGGPEALVVEGPEARRLHALLAGNERLEYACGFHWSLDFEYDDHTVESLTVNEQCESFRQSGDEIWRALRPYFKRALERPSHSLVRIEAPPDQTATIKRQLEPRFGIAFRTDTTGGTLLLASLGPWTPERIEAIRKATPLATRIQAIYSYDTGS